ncbi:Putative LOC100898192, partial [Caligus rogercresseyi]
RSGYSIPFEYRTLDSGENFLLYDSGVMDDQRILIFGTQGGLNDLTNIKDWSCDGTFKCAPSLYYQLFTLHVVVRHSSIPRIFALLPNKTTNTYLRLLGCLKHIHPRLNPENVMMDFEKGVISAFEEVFPQANYQD